MKVFSANFCGRTYIIIGPEQFAKVFSTKFSRESFLLQNFSAMRHICARLLIRSNLCFLTFEPHQKNLLQRSPCNSNRCIRRNILNCNSQKFSQQKLFSSNNTMLASIVHWVTTNLRTFSSQKCFFKFVKIFPATESYYKHISLIPGRKTLSIISNFFQ